MWSPPRRTAPATITSDEDYGELKRHRWEFQHATSFAYGILSADGTEEVACVYVNPSKKQGYDATVRFLMTERGANMVFDRASVILSTVDVDVTPVAVQRLDKALPHVKVELTAVPAGTVIPGAPAPVAAAPRPAAAPALAPAAGAPPVRR